VPPDLIFSSNFDIKRSLFRRATTMGLAAFAAIALLALPLAVSAQAPGDPVPVRVTTGGLVADLYTPKDMHGQMPAIIELGGSEGGMGAGAAKDARLIAKHGYVVLQVAYFDMPGLPKELGLIPLEYFKSAIDYLRALPDVDRDRIGIEGTSVGGEVALAVAAHYPEIKAVVAAVPSSVVWPGISHTSPNPPSTFTLAGQPLPDLPYGLTGSFKGVYALYADGLRNLDQHPDAVIPVERINGPVMLVCGKADTLWPSCPMSEQVAARLTSKGFKQKVKLLEYPDAGHAVFGPPANPASPNYKNLGSLGGSADGVNAARQDDWPRALAFMDEALKR
jgi:dienelactone hydrolase